MAYEGGLTKAELNDTLDEVADLLDSALDAELTREEVISKVKEAYDLVAGEVEDEEDEDEEAALFWTLDASENRLLKKLLDCGLPFHINTQLMGLFRQVMSADLQTTERCASFANALRCVADAVEKDYT